eukprot:TRINITY_DN3838_c0_g1_i1.p1 TRINITY_DN3838_c0_g1~~TRINITY_DN3838_c0_g1_i1.p1  ORF type:complete len:993 (+),score=257.64 TRINITY_DN3838_c0_g1_i1:46-3024(+)
MQQHTVQVHAVWFAIAQTIVVGGSFVLTLLSALHLHFAGIVKNEWYSEWWPSISAVVGDYAPEKNIFAYGMALAAFPKFVCAAVVCYMVLQRASSATATACDSAPKFARATAVTAIARLLSAGGWIFVSSSDHAIVHAVSMGVYLFACNFYMAFHVHLSVMLDLHERGKGATWRQVIVFWWRMLFFVGFLTTMAIALNYFYLHKGLQQIGAYAWYSVFEWGLVVCDVGFDAACILDFAGITFGVTFPAVLSAPATAADLKTDDNEEAGVSVELVWEIVAGLIFWTNLTEFITLIWFFPLVFMDVTGYEVVVFLQLAPFALGISSLLRSTVKYRAVLHLVAIAGVAALLFVGPLVPRLMLQAMGTMLGMFASFGVYWHQKIGMRAMWGQALSLLVFVAVRFVFLSANPVSAFPIVNGTFCAVAAASMLLLFRSDLMYCQQVSKLEARTLSVGAKSKAAPVRRGKAALQSTGSTSSSSDNAVTVTVKKPIAVPLVERHTQNPWFRAGALFGAELFLIHHLFTEHGVISRWTDVPPFPGGLVVLLSMSLGLFLSRYPLLMSTPALSLFAPLGGCLLMWYMQGYIAFLGGCFLAVFVFAMLPFAVANIRVCSPGKALFTALLTYMIGVFGSVWVVAYNFVPFGGEQMREAPHYVLFAYELVVIITGPLLADRYMVHTKPRLLRARAARWPTTPTCGMIAVLIVVTGVCVTVPAVTRLRTAVQLTGHHRQPVPGVGGEIWPARIPQYTNSTMEFNAMIWTIHFGYDNDGVLNYKKVEDTIRSRNPQIVGLLESDLSRLFLGSRDLVEYLADKLQMYSDFGPPTRDNTWGCAILSKFPIRAVEHYLLSSPEGELACALRAEIDIGGHLTHVFVTHMGNWGDHLDRKLQSQEIAQIASKYAHQPFLFLGYVTSSPDSVNYHRILHEGRLTDIDPSDLDRWCQYICYRGMQRLNYARINSGDIADTEQQAARFRLGDGIRDGIDRDIATGRQVSPCTKVV